MFGRYQKGVAVKGGGAARVSGEAPMTLKPEFILWDHLKCGNGSLMTSGTFKIVALP